MFDMIVRLLLRTVFEKLLEGTVWLIDKLLGEESFIDKKTGNVVVSRGRSFKILAVVLLILGLLCSYSAFDMSKQEGQLHTSDDWVALTIVSVILIVPALILYIMSLTKFSYGEKGITKRRILSPDLIIEWENLEKVEFDVILDHYVVIGKGGTKIKVSADLVGIEGFINEVKRRRADVYRGS